MSTILCSKCFNQKREIRTIFEGIRRPTGRRSHSQPAPPPPLPPFFTAQVQCQPFVHRRHTCLNHLRTSSYMPAARLTLHFGGTGGRSTTSPRSTLPFEGFWGEKSVQRASRLVTILKPTCHYGQYTAIRSSYKIETHVA